MSESVTNIIDSENVILSMYTYIKQHLRQTFIEEKPNLTKILC